LKKEWWTVKAPGMFMNRTFTKSPVNVSAGKKLSSETMKGRVYESNLGDLHNINTYKKIQLIVDDTASGENKTCLTNFHGFDTTKDHINSLIMKWHTLIETFVDCKTTDGFLLRLFPIAFTQRNKYQLRATTYAQVSQVKQIRRQMRQITARFISKHTLKDCVNGLIHENLAKEMTDAAKKIFPIKHCIIRKVKTIKRPRYDGNNIIYILMYF
jgi:small subunit ribosomal protein S3Ae